MNFLLKLIFYLPTWSILVVAGLPGCFADYSSPECENNADCPVQFDHCFGGYCILKKGAVWPPVVADSMVDVSGAAGDVALDTKADGANADTSESFCVAIADGCCALPLNERNLDPDCTVWELGALGSQPAIPAVDRERGRIHLVYHTKMTTDCMLQSFDLETGKSFAALPFPCDRTLNPVVLPGGDVLAYSSVVFRFDVRLNKVAWWKESSDLPGPITAPASVQGYQAALVSDQTLIGIDALTGEQIAGWTHPSGASLSAPLWKGTTLFLATSDGTVLRFPTLQGGENTKGELGNQGTPAPPVPWLSEKIAVIIGTSPPSDNVFAVRTVGNYPTWAGSNRVEKMDVLTEPVVIAGGVLTVRQTDGSLVFVSPGLGLQPLDVESTNLTSPMVVTRSAILAGTNEGVVAIHPVTGRVLWTYATAAPLYQPPVPVGDGTAIVVTSDARVIRIAGVPDGLDAGSPWPKPRGNLANTGATDTP